MSILLTAAEVVVEGAFEASILFTGWLSKVSALDRKSVGGELVGGGGGGPSLVGSAGLGFLAGGLVLLLGGVFRLPSGRMLMLMGLHLRAGETA